LNWESKKEFFLKKLTSFFKKLQLGRILTIFLAGAVLFITTACNSGDVRGARPENPPVQVGGANNPHKLGGDGYTEYKASTDPRVNNKTANQKRDRADSQLTSDKLIAATQSDLIYPGSETNSKQLPDIIPGSEKVLKGGQIPAERQPIVDRNDPNSKILERVGEAFNDAGAFLKDDGDAAATRPELQSNPALHK